ncbi:MAG: nucleotidyl transferase AbiEii/AbiGii toxin family protein [Filimonas sp.]|nr:nucleotidyl transferase AbiEii/AbiGii toxin family protein [Filimonas sp.]
MQEIDYNLLEQIACDAFIRRAAEVNLPFALKGSYLTRQYFENPEDRIPADLDWIYLNKIKDPETAREEFDKWMIAITELPLHDNVSFRSFRENQFWRMMDYAMADDFPTVNTDFKCWANGIELDISLDISFNLPIQDVPVALEYRPVQGTPFNVSYTIPLNLQIAWKIHQTLVRPRFKDLFDLTHLVQHPTMNKNVLQKAIEALKEECKADNVKQEKIDNFFTYKIAKLFTGASIDAAWKQWRHNGPGWGLHEQRVAFIFDNNTVPEDLSVFLQQFESNMRNAGFDMTIIEQVFQSHLKKNQSTWYYIKSFFK